MAHISSYNLFDILIALLQIYRHLCSNMLVFSELLLVDENIFCNLIYSKTVVIIEFHL